VTVILWDIKTGAKEINLKSHSGSVTSVLVDPHGHTIVGGRKDYSVQLWDVRSYLVTMNLTPVLGEVCSLSSDSSFERILASTKDNTNRI
jgi:WD40 repeat protein